MPVMNPLEKYMAEQELDVKKVANDLNVSMSAIYRWLRGETVPSQTHMRKIARYVGEDNKTSLQLRDEWLEWIDGEED